MKEQEYNQFGKDRINVFQPRVSDEKMEIISNICKELNHKNLYIDWKNLIELAVSDLLNIFLDEDSIEDQMDYSNARQNADELIKHLNEHVGNNQLRIRGILYLLKTQLETMYNVGYNKPIQIQPSLNVNYFTPLTDSQTVVEFVNHCKNNFISPLEVLDIGLCWYGVEETTAYETVSDMSLMDIDRIGSGAVVAKMANGYLKYLDTTPYERVLSILIITKAIMSSMMGVCPQQLKNDDNNCNCDNNGDGCNCE